jgi:hypothetical protein
LAPAAAELVADAVVDLTAVATEVGVDVDVVDFAVTEGDDGWTVPERGNTVLGVDTRMGLGVTIERCSVDDDTGVS